MKWWVASLGAGVVLLLLADALAFHDLFEPHTTRDWLMLLGSALAIVAFLGMSAERWRDVAHRG